MTLRELLFELSSYESIEEASKAKVGKFTARRDQPHFQGDVYHAHVEDGKYEYSWQQDGQRRHPGKFGAIIPKNAKEAAAKVLNTDSSFLEDEVTEVNLAKFFELLREELFRD